jgi:hypothetical protein
MPNLDGGRHMRDMSLVLSEALLKFAEPLGIDE